MSKVEDLIERLCPNGVPYIKLQEMAEIGTGRSDRKDAIENGEFPFYVRSKDILRINKYEYDENAIIIPGEGGIGEIFHYVNGKYALHQRAYRIRVIDSKLNTKFLYYYMFSKFKNFITNKAVTATVTSIRKPMIEQFPVAVPPMEVQNEIVHILDDFTLLSAELSAELKARQKQYEFYKNQLYDFKNKEVKYVKLGEIAEIIRGGNFQKKDFVENGKPCIHYGQIYTKYGSSAEKTFTFVNEEIFKKSKIAQPNDIVMAVTSENIEDVCKCVAWLGNENIAVSGHTAIIHHNINAKYLSYYFSTLHFFKQKEKLAHGTKVIEVTPSSLNNIKLPLPSIEEQELIANKIERFDKLCNDISVGLPAEIEARKKQYEYYRDKLLTFKELKVEE